MSGPCQFVASVENISLMQCISRLKIVKPVLTKESPRWIEEDQAPLFLSATVAQSPLNLLFQVALWRRRGCALVLQSVPAKEEKEAKDLFSKMHSSSREYLYSSDVWFWTKCKISFTTSWSIYGRLWTKVKLYCIRRLLIIVSSNNVAIMINIIIELKKVSIIYMDSPAVVLLQRPNMTPTFLYCDLVSMPGHCLLPIHFMSLLSSSVKHYIAIIIYCCHQKFWAPPLW